MAVPNKGKAPLNRALMIANGAFADAAHEPQPQEEQTLRRTVIPWCSRLEVIAKTIGVNNIDSFCEEKSRAGRDGILASICSSYQRHSRYQVTGLISHVLVLSSYLFHIGFEYLASPAFPQEQSQYSDDSGDYSCNPVRTDQPAGDVARQCIYSTPIFLLSHPTCLQETHKPLYWGEH
ncbi:hypothetical protein KCU76_g32, partial [Aureobasidium melanogenum]